MTYTTNGVNSGVQVMQSTLGEALPDYSKCYIN